MTKITGLPLEYDELSQYFDAHNIGDDTNEKNAVIANLLKEFSANNILDLTCGTGCQVFYLKNLGFEIIGADFSEKLLKIARKKAEDLGVEAEFIDGDMRDLQVGNFDAVITMFNAIGHLTKDDFALALKNIYNNLREGGIYIFDIFNLDVFTDQKVADLAMDFEKIVNGDKIHNIQYSTLNKDTGMLTSHDKYEISEASGKVKKLENSFDMQIYNLSQLQNILSENGFKIIKNSGILGEEFIENSSLNMLIVAQK